MMKSVSAAFVPTNFTGMAIFGLTSIFLFASIVGISHTAGMQLNERGEMSGCVFTGKVMLCKMNVVEHISLWQSMRTATLQKIGILVLLLVSVFAVELFIFRRYLFHFLRSGPSFLEQLVNRQLNNIFRDPIRYGLAKGILHPRIYEPTHL